MKPLSGSADRGFLLKKRGLRLLRQPSDVIFMRILQNVYA